MLDAHPELAIPPETHFIRRVVQACETSPQPREAFVQSLTTHSRWETFGLDKTELAARITQTPTFSAGEGLRIFYGLYAARFNKRRWGDKSPGYVRHMKLIARELPEAFFIHLIRDGRDVALSVKDLWFGPDSIAEAAENWRSLIEDARRQARRVKRYIELRYEDLVLDPEKILRELCRCLKLVWDRAVLDYHDTAADRLGEIFRDTRDNSDTRLIRADEMRAIHQHALQSPQTNRIARWRAEMSDVDLELFESIAGKTLRSLNYPTS